MHDAIRKKIKKKIKKKTLNSEFNDFVLHWVEAISFIFWGDFLDLWGRKHFFLYFEHIGRSIDLLKYFFIEVKTNSKIEIVS